MVVRSFFVCAFCGWGGGGGECGSGGGGGWEGLGFREQTSASEILVVGVG